MIIENKLYEGEINLLFDSFRHQYFKEGVKIPSVTSVLSVISKPQLINWAVRQTAEFMEENLKPGISYDEIQIKTMIDEAKTAHYKKKSDAAGYGIWMHQYVEDYIKGKNPSLPVHEGLAEAVKKFHSWREEHKVKFILSEQVIYSKLFGFTGTLDFVAKIDGKLIVGDLKTSSSIYDEMWLQVAAYRLARSEEFPTEKYEGQAILRIAKDGTFEFALAPEYDKHTDAFLNALKLYNALEEMKGVKK